MNKNNTCISVIIPSYKGSDTIYRALSSLEKQSFHDFEVIVVDDNGEGSSEQVNTKRIVTSFETKLDIKYITHKNNKNGAVARNTGVKVANGEYVAFLDDDDIYLEKRLENAYHYLENKKYIDIYFCAVLIERNGKLAGIITPQVFNDDINRTLLFNTSVFGTGSNIFIRKETYLSIGGFNELYFRRQDNEFLLRALTKMNYAIDSSIDIVKCNIGNTNIPSYNKLLSSNEQFYKDFEGMLKDLSDSEYRLLMGKERARILFCCMMNESPSIVKVEKGKLEDIRPLNNKEIAQYVLSRIRIGGKGLLYYIQPLMSKLKNYKQDKYLRKTLDEGILSQLSYYNIINSSFAFRF